MKNILDVESYNQTGHSIIFLFLPIQQAEKRSSKNGRAGTANCGAAQDINASLNFLNYKKGTIMWSTRKSYHTPIGYSGWNSR